MEQSPRTHFHCLIARHVQAVAGHCVVVPVPGPSSEASLIIGSFNGVRRLTVPLLSNQFNIFNLISYNFYLKQNVVDLNHLSTMAHRMGQPSSTNTHKRRHFALISIKWPFCHPWWLLLGLLIYVMTLSKLLNARLIRRPQSNKKTLILKKNIVMCTLSLCLFVFQKTFERK